MKSGKIIREVQPSEIDSLCGFLETTPKNTGQIKHDNIDANQNHTPSHIWRGLLHGMGLVLFLFLPPHRHRIFNFIHNRRGADILSDVLSNQMCWEGASKAKYSDQYWVRYVYVLRDKVTWHLFWRGKQDFDAEDVANTILPIRMLFTVYAEPQISNLFRCGH